MRLRLPLPNSCLRLLVALVGLGCLSCSGGGKLYPAQGKLLYKNQPLDGATLTFHLVGGSANTVPPTAVTEEDGSFTVTTGLKEGAPAGEYVVTMVCPKIAAAKSKNTVAFGDRAQIKDRFNGAYANEARSKIKVAIRDGAPELPTINFE
jgi:hypothetical protein